MGAHDRPFPPGGLPLADARLFKMAYDLAYHTQYLAEKYAVEGQAGQTMIRKLGTFELRVEFEVGRSPDLTRYTVMIWYEEHLVFNAWCSRIAETGATVGDIVTCEEGPWKAHLRRRSEKEEKT